MNPRAFVARRFSPKYVLQIVRVFKRITARELFRRKPELKRALWGAFWSAGYYVATVGERGDWSVVERYVKNQGNPKEDWPRR